MTITIDLPTEVEEKIKTQASEKDTSVEKYIALLILEDLGFSEEKMDLIVVKIID